jgi:RNA polymerase sigma-70 factor (ECF subfamily)
MKDKLQAEQPKKQAVSVPIDPLEQESKRFTQLFSELVPDLSASIKALVYDTNNVKEIIQNVAVILWEKYRNVSDKTEFRKVAYTVLRYELLAYRRDRARDRLVFDESVIALIVDHSSVEEPEIPREQELLEQFIATLNAEDKELLFSAYQSEMKIKDIAQNRGKTPMSMYKRLQKIRAELVEFVTKELKK